MRTNYIPDEVVEHGMEIVGGVTGEQPNRFLKGFISFDEYSALAGYGVILDDYSASVANKPLPLSFNLVDMMLGPL
jgi:hypothetical protein